MIIILDLLFMRVLFLGNIEEILNNMSWRFVDVSYEFLNLLNLWVGELLEFIIIGFLSNCMVNVNFIGIKIGDVNVIV